MIIRPACAYLRAPGRMPERGTRRRSPTCGEAQAGTEAVAPGSPPNRASRPLRREPDVVTAADAVDRLSGSSRFREGTLMTSVEA